MLDVKDLHVGYGAVDALVGVSLVASAGSTTAILGANGAGKSSLLRAICGLAPVKSGSILLESQDVTKLPTPRRAKLGIAHAMEGRRLFTQLTVADNLNLAWHFGQRSVPAGKAVQATYDRFPILAEKMRTPAGLLSGGQQQMLILSCATIRSPRYLLLDEPSLGLAPVIVTQIYEFITSYARNSGATVIIAEQMAAVALKVSDHGYVLRRGRVVLQGKSQELLAAAGAAGTLSSTYL
jgi:branched-chain amino acid transport system ATP-binding protein